MTNPYSARSMDAALDTALDMPAAAGRQRMAAMSRTVRHYDVARWAAHTLDRFGEIGVGMGEPARAAVG